MSLVLAILLVLFALACCCLTLINMPGNWVMLAGAGAYWLWAPVDSESRLFLHTGVMIALLVLASIGEILELLAGALGAKRGGGSRRGAVLAIIGSFIGSLVGGFVGLPFLPTLVGAVVSIVLFAGIGATAGAMLGEKWKGRSLGESWQVGKGAFWGRLLGTVAKIMIAGAMSTTLTLSLCLHSF